MNQKKLPKPLATPAPGFFTNSRPNGHKAYIPTRKDATPNGIPTTVTHQSAATKTYPRNSQKPASTSHKTFRRVFM